MPTDMELSPSNVARHRLAVLAAHLSAASLEPPVMASSLEAHCVSAQTMVAPPELVKGTLTIVDERTGKRYQVQVSEEGTIKATDLKKITTGPNDKGLKLYDPGYLNTAPVRSSISYIDGDLGILRYRGYPIEELAESSTYVEVAYLLMYGNLPSQSQLADWEFAISQHSAVPQGLLDIIQAMPHDAHPMGVLVSAMSALSVFHPDANPALRGQDLYKSKQVRDKQIARIIGKAPTIAAAAYLRLAGRPPVLPSSNLSYSENFLYMLDSLGNRSYKPNPRLARVLDILFILHAEHEMNCSTSAARHLASSGVDVFTALSGAVGALYGPLHGGANEAVLKMLSEIGTVNNIPEFIEGVKNRKRKMSGFGHRVYKNYDPRAKVIRKLAEEVFSIVGRDPLIEVAVALEKAALSDEYFVKRKLYPNVDFYSGLIYRAMGFPPEFFTVLFAIPRMAGYLAHWRESLDDPDTKIIRPQQVYTGEWLRHYIPPNERLVPAKADRLGQVSVSNASKRRLSGSGI
ncbi:citrate synthase, glyoxysomal [Cucurbita pepo subsp. pepo]|uniref:Citrate synthase n=1 Tax=Cucurbita moschata TaxID=3662 RepID=A0A6J1FWJ1_CUCMO|nr:citrate synthase, glyoxysomal [Cucurbita moschata]XP_023512768.1 citrate synthase, glyoxysomal [Cucurbita pepo subsp. pepo]